jgi:hypothetical protein
MVDPLFGLLSVRILSIALTANQREAAESWRDRIISWNLRHLATNIRFCPAMILSLLHDFAGEGV